MTEDKLKQSLAIRITQKIKNDKTNPFIFDL